MAADFIWEPQICIPQPRRFNIQSSIMESGEEERLLIDRTPSSEMYTLQFNVIDGTTKAAIQQHHDLIALGSYNAFFWTAIPEIIQTQYNLGTEMQVRYERFGIPQFLSGGDGNGLYNLTIQFRRVI